MECSFTMNYTEFQSTLNQPLPPAGLSAPLLALWLDAKGDWNGAHEAIQDETDRSSAWLHAYLHRKEGDQWNADYWYSKAGKKSPRCSLTEEWEVIARALLNP
jgi:hypothetical protein